MCGRRRAARAGRPRRRRRATPTPRSPRPGRPAAVTTGPLGPKDGGVYPAVHGFGQNFAGGKIFFTPDTGAHIMLGAILEKYESLGGPADGDLGFPTIDEGAGKAPGQPQHHVQRGRQPGHLLDAGHRRAGGARRDQRGVGQARRFGGRRSGCPTEDETYRRRRRRRRSSPAASCRGTARPRRSPRRRPSWPISSPASQVPATPHRRSTPPAGRRAVRWARWVPPRARQYTIGADGVGQNFAGGKIFYSPATGANVVTGQVLAKYESVGGPTGDLGFPTSSEADGGLAPKSRVGTFAAADKPVIFWTPDFGAVIVRGAMNAAWDKLGGATRRARRPDGRSDRERRRHHPEVQRRRDLLGQGDQEVQHRTGQPRVVSLPGSRCPGQDVPQAPPRRAGVRRRRRRRPVVLEPVRQLRWWLLVAMRPDLLRGGAQSSSPWCCNRRRRTTIGDDH